MKNRDHRTLTTTNHNSNTKRQTKQVLKKLSNKLKSNVEKQFIRKNSNKILFAKKNSRIKQSWIDTTLGQITKSIR